MNNEIQRPLKICRVCRTPKDINCFSRSEWLRYRSRCTVCTRESTLKRRADREQREQLIRSQSRQHAAEAEQSFWGWVDFELRSNSNITEQALLDSVRVPGYIGRKARVGIESCGLNGGDQQ